VPEYKRPQPSHYWDNVQNKQSRFQKPTQTHYWDDYRRQLEAQKTGATKTTESVVSKLQLIEWARSYAWDVEFIPGIPQPFDTISPAFEVEENMVTPETYTTPAGMMTLVFPQNTNERTINLTFYDDVGGTIENWLKDWYNKIYNTDNQYVTTLEEASRTVTIKRRDLQKNTIQSNSYLVFPRSPLQFIGSSDSAVRQHSQEFVIAGTISE
jgi:hypothetical protein